MTTTQIPAEHISRMRAASDDELYKLGTHNRALGRKNWMSNRDISRKAYAYADVAQAILDERRYGPVADVATDAQVGYISKLLARRTTEDGFSGRVSKLMNGTVVDLAAVRALTKAEASQVIDSLTNNY